MTAISPDTGKTPGSGAAARTRTPLSRATDPQTTVWVSANAGSGKTYVLSRRVIRLMLEGVRPSELLCLTFTKVAAAEMSNRVFSILGDWVQLDDGRLSAEISALTGNTTTPRQLRRARELFATALDTPGGLRVQTIHAFCESLLHQFPLEANIPGHFDMMGDSDQALLLDEARRRVILAGLGVTRSHVGADAKAADTRRRLGEALEAVQAHASDFAFEEALTQLVHEREQFSDWVEAGGGSIRDAFAPAWDALGVSPETTEAELYADFARETAYDASSLEVLKAALAAKGGTKANEALGLLSAITTANGPEEAFFARHAAFLVKNSKSSIGIKGREFFVSHSFIDDNGFREKFDAEKTQLLAQLEKLKALRVLKASEALFEIAWSMLTEYGNLKQQRGLLDFNDLIAKTLNLLKRSEIAAWVQYKLDAGIRHVLVDEAQDTSPRQWEIIRLLTGDFYSGEGAKEGTRTLFVVGDEKQSIFSFQGADPAEFDKQYREINKLAQDAGQRPDLVPLTTSYRSTDEILSAVDRVFSLPENRKGLTSADVPPDHTANRQGQPGDVYVWPLERKEKDEPRDRWNDPVDRTGSNAAESRLAARIADTIKGWIDNEETLPAHSDPIREGDILILVRKRDRFVKAMNMALKHRGLNAAGADRLKLTEHIAVEDMIALGRFATTPADDLSLAGLLKSPLFDFDEDQLMEVAIDRGSKTLLQSIGEKAETDNKLRGDFAVLTAIIRDADRMPVHDFYARLFARYRLRARYLERLGNEVEEIFDGFFQTLIDYDRTNGSGQGGLGLLNFVEWLESAAPELKREIELESNEIRVITAHSSKGLEKPIVFLVDPGGEAFISKHLPSILWTREAGVRKFPLWRSKKASHLAILDDEVATIKAKAEEEYRRLLYVGMTRAGDRLIVCGYGKENITYPHWQSMVLNGLREGTGRHKGQLEEVRNDQHNISHWKWQIERDVVRMAKTEQRTTSARDGSDDLPRWISPARIEQPVPRPLSPSGVLSMLEIAPEREPPSAEANRQALLKGNLTHQLLQALPELDADARRPFADNWLAHTKDQVEPELRDAITRDVFGVLNEPELAPLFAPGSRGEVEIAGDLTLGGISRKVHGKIDRIVVRDDEILVADYKTNAQVPTSPENVPETYLAQMALYRALLQKVYRDRDIVTMLVWTRNGTTMPLPADLLDRQIERLNVVGTG